MEAKLIDKWDAIPVQPLNIPLRIISVIVYIGCLLVNGLIGTLPGDRSAGAISDKYHLYYTPPGFTFIIWAVIYITFSVLVFYSIWKNIWSIKTYIWLNSTNILNGLWVYIWSFGTLTTIAVCLFILLALSPSLFFMWKSVYDPKETSWIYFISRNIIAFYLGWTIGANLLNLGVVLVYNLGVSQLAVTIMFWILCPILAVGASLLNYYLEDGHGFKSCFCLWLSVLWAMSGALITTLKNV